jgi:hypothetical protein
MVFLALQFVQLVPAQRSAGNQSMIGVAIESTVVSSGINRAAGALPLAGCDGGPFWDQYNNPATDAPVGIGSQKFEPVMSGFDDQAADDFVIGAGWGAPYITGVRVMGEYSAGGGPASSFSIYFYQNGAGNLPGTLIAAFMNLSYVETPPDFLICLPNPFSVSPGTYWVSVQARQDSNPNGQWFWHNRTVQSNSGAAWQNPGNGYGTGCVTWNRKNACMVDQTWPDQVFQILGFREGPTPSPKPRPTPRPRPTPVPRPSL